MPAIQSSQGPCLGRSAPCELEGCLPKVRSQAEQGALLGRGSAKASAQGGPACTDQPGGRYLQCGEPALRNSRGRRKIRCLRRPPYLTIANGDEPFDTVMSGQLMVDNPAPGEVIWRDDLGVTCRRWNWRQCNRTRLDGFGGAMWFVLEALESMPAQMLEEAASTLVDGLVRLMPGCKIKAFDFSATAEFAIR